MNLLVVDLDDTLFRQSDFDDRVIDLTFSAMSASYPGLFFKEKFFLDLVKRERRINRNDRSLFDRLFDQHGYPAAAADIFVRTYQEKAKAYDESLLVSEEARRFLEHNRNNFLVIMATNGPKAQQASKVKALGIAYLFDFILYLDGSDLYPLKPDPGPITNILKREGISALSFRSSVIGDSMHDRQLARNLGIRYVHPVSLGWLAGDPS